MQKSYHIAIVGATGAVGMELLGVLERRAFPVKTLRPLASARSAGKSVSFRGEEIAVEELRSGFLRRNRYRFLQRGRGSSRGNTSPSPAMLELS